MKYNIEMERKIWREIESRKPLKKAFFSGPGYEPEPVKEIWKTLENPAEEYLQKQSIPA